MLNKKNERELAYLVQIDNIEPIIGSDNCEAAIVNGWHVLVSKGDFKPNDIAVFFEVDSKLPEVDPFISMEFLKAKHYKIKTQKFTFGGKGNFISQGLLLPLSAWENNGGLPSWLLSIKIAYSNGINLIDSDIRFLTETLGVTYAVPDDNTRKAKPVDKYISMSRRNPNLGKTAWWRWLYRYMWGKKILFFFFGHREDKKVGWPSHIAAKTDVERVQNMKYILNDKRPFVATEKVDGSSCSIMAERTKRGKIKQYVCSRNVVFETSNDKCFYERNIYFEAYEKYDLKEKIVQIMNDLNLKNVAIQMEVFGPSVQKRDYSLKEREAKVFHIVSEGTKFPMDKTVEICEKYGIPHVPIIDDNYILPDTIEELQEFVESAPSMIDGKEKEGIVFYDKETGQQYFKFVSPEFLMKYHK